MRLNVQSCFLSTLYVYRNLRRAVPLLVLTGGALQAHARGEQTRLYYLGFIGESRVLKKEANEPMTSLSKFLDRGAQHLPGD